MNLSAMQTSWQNESKGKLLTTSSIRNTGRGYDQSDVDNMLKQISEGISQTQAAKNNNIPRGSVARLLPENLRGNRSKTYALELVRDKLNGKLESTLLQIAERTDCKIHTLNYFVKKVKDEKLQVNC